MLDAGELEQLIEDSTVYPSPQVISTERPDYTAELLVSGRVAIIVDGSPNVLVVPITAFDLMHSLKTTTYVSVCQPAAVHTLYRRVSRPAAAGTVCSYHELPPRDDPHGSAAGNRSVEEKVPFPSLVEILLMEISFELIREAGLRVPGPIGPTLGIIGG